MKIAIIYTGQIRTIKKTIPFLKKNVLLNDNIHIFATLQTDGNDNSFIQENLKENLKSLVWFSKDNDWNKNTDRMLSIMNIHEHYKNYLRNSGSIIEYSQLFISYQKMVLYESNNNFEYDYVIRCRTDTIFCKPIDFSWLNLSDDDILFRLNYIRDILSEESIINEKLLTYFMSTIINKDLLKNIKEINYDESEFPKESQYINKNDVNLVKFIETGSIKDLKNYIKNGLYILTIRKNLLYILRRKNFSLIPSISNCYGSLNFFKNEYWWNAESQFRSACAYSQLSIFDYSTGFEENSLYDYNPQKFFDESGNMKKEMLYCLIRY